MGLTRSKQSTDERCGSSHRRIAIRVLIDRSNRDREIERCARFAERAESDRKVPPPHARHLAGQSLTQIEKATLRSARSLIAKLQIANASACTITATSFAAK